MDAYERVAASPITAGSHSVGSSVGAALHRGCIAAPIFLSERNDEPRCAIPPIARECANLHQAKINGSHCSGWREMRCGSRSCRSSRHCDDPRRIPVDRDRGGSTEGAAWDLSAIPALAFAPLAACPIGLIAVSLVVRSRKELSYH